MMTLRKEESLINKLKGLSELELHPILTELIEHLGKNKMLHLVDEVFNSDEIDELSHELSRTKDELEEKESELDDLRSYVDRAVTILEAIDEDDEPEKIKSEIDKAVNLIQ